jgi:hypothetical protein
LKRALVVLLVLAASRVAAAYPQFQLSTGAVRCSQCHLSPVGGGILTEYGRDESVDDISNGGNRFFLHHLVTPPSWLRLGGDLRVAGVLEDEGASSGVDGGVFPMQTDLYAAFLLPKGLSLNLTGGFRGAARPRDPSLASRMVSREHYLMWRPKSKGIYVRIGRFFAPFGLRLPDHTSYTRRYTGFHTLEETYNVSVGWVENDYELHLTAFTPDFFRPVGSRANGVAVYGERRLEHGRATLGVQARLALAPDDRRYDTGLVYKRTFLDSKLLLMSELDVIRQDFTADGLDGQTQLVAHLSGNWFPKRGWLVSLTGERYDEDLAVKGVARDALTFSLQWFPRAHFEVQLMLRERFLGAGSGGDPAHLGLLQVHYYL